MGGYQETIVRSNPANTISYVPTSDMLSGNFAPAQAAGCFTGAPTGPLAGGTTISSGALSSVALAYSKYLPVSTDPCGKITYAIPAPQSDRQALGRGDYQISQRQMLFGRYFFARNNQPAPSFDNNALNTAAGGVLNEVQSFVLGHTFTITPSTLNSFRGTLNRAVNQRIAVPFQSPTDFGVTMTQLIPDYSAIVAGSAFQVGSSLANSAHFNTTIYQFADDVDKTLGAHNLQFGGSYLRVLLNGPEQPILQRTIYLFRSAHRLYPGRFPPRPAQRLYPELHPAGRPAAIRLCLLWTGLMEDQPASPAQLWHALGTVESHDRNSWSCGAL